MGLYRDMLILKWLKFIMMYHDFTEAVLVELMEASGWVLWYYDSIITCTCMSNYHLVYIMKSLNFFLGHFSWIVNLSELFTYNGNWYIITLLCMVRVNWTLAWKIRSCQSDVKRLTCQHALVRIDALLLQRAKEFTWRSVRRGKKQLSNQRRKSRSKLYSLWTERWVSHRDCCTRWTDSLKYWKHDEPMV